MINELEDRELRIESVREGLDLDVLGFVAYAIGRVMKPFVGTEYPGRNILLMLESWKLI